MALDLKISVDDVKNMLRDQAFANYDGFDADILRDIKRQTSRVTVLIRQQGYDPDEVAADLDGSGDPVLDGDGVVAVEGLHQELWWLCQEIVLLRCAANLEEAVSHTRTALSGGRIGRASNIVQEIIDMAESVSKEFDSSKQRGSWNYGNEEQVRGWGATDSEGYPLSPRWGEFRGL